MDAKLFIYVGLLLLKMLYKVAVNRLNLKVICIVSFSLMGLSLYSITLLQVTCRVDVEQLKNTDVNTSSGELSQKLLELLNLLNEAECADTFLLLYEAFCDKKLAPTYAPSASLNGVGTMDSLKGHLEPCPCVPRHQLSKSGVLII